MFIDGRDGGLLLLFTSASMGIWRASSASTSIAGSPLSLRLNIISPHMKMGLDNLSPMRRIEIVDELEKGLFIHTVLMVAAHEYNSSTPLIVVKTEVRTHF